MSLRPTLAALAAGPWCWPRPDTIAAETLVARFGPAREPGAGEVTALTVRDSVVTLWLVARRAPANCVVAALGAGARESWRAASLALPRSVPVLWRDVHQAASVEPIVAALDLTRASPGFMPTEAMVDGPSFGLAFFLQLASSVLDCPVPGHLIACASIDALGRTGEVGALADKIGGLRVLAPRIDTVLVAADQADDARRLAGGRLTVIGVRSAAEALERAFGDQLSRLLSEAGADDERRRELTDSFFRLALVGRGAAVDWSPVERGAARALTSWPALDDDLRYRLTFAQAVAARHENNGGELPLPGRDWLAAQPHALQVHMMAHLVQQSSDTGTPPADAVQALAAELRPRILRSGFVPELRLVGACARLQALTGRASDALATQEQLVQVFLDLYAEHEVSYPLAEWFRLSGALRDEPALRRATDVHRQMTTAGGYGDHGEPYVRLAQARAVLLIDPSDQAARRAAQLVYADDGLPTHLRWSACRWADADAQVALAKAARTDRIAQRYLVLRALDEAAAGGDRDRTMSLVFDLEQLDPGPVGHLRRSGAAPGDIARLYPY